MKLSLATYKNSYFNFYINFSYGWIFRKRSKSNTSNMHYQIHDGDLPEADGDYKTLFSARYRLNKPLMSRCNFSMSVHRKSEQFDLFKFSQEKPDVSYCKYSHIKFLGSDAQEVIIEQRYHEKILLTKVVMWNALPELCISAVAEGDSLENFNIAESLFSGIYQLST